MKSRLIIAIAAFSICLANNEKSFAQEPNTSAAAPKDGDSCKVTAGPNKGKTGKYTDEATWCEGSWGSTECKDQAGNSKCSAARLLPAFSKVEVTMVRGYLEATQPGANPKALKAWEVKYKANVIRRKNTIAISLPNKTLTFDGSTEGLNDIFERAATKQKGE